MLEQVNGASTKLSGLYGYLEKVFFSSTTTSASTVTARGRTISEASQEALGSQRSPSRPGQEEPPLSSPDLGAPLCSWSDAVWYQEPVPVPDAC